MIDVEVAMSGPVDRHARVPLIVAVLGLAGIGLEWLAVQLLGLAALPTESLAESPSPLASPSPTPTVASTVLPLAAFDPSLPEAFALPEGIWETTGPGWVLATYSPSVRASNPHAAGVTEFVGPQVIYLIAPDGTRYQVLTMDPDVPIHLQSWSAGEDHAYIDACAGPGCPSGPGSTALLDLTTGEISSLGALGDPGVVMATLPGSRRVWSGNLGNGLVEHNGIATSFEGGWAPWQVSPTGEYVSLQRFVEVEPQHQELRAAIASTITGALVSLEGLDPAASCFPDEWLDPTSLIIGCTLAGGNRQAYLANAATGAVTPVTASDPVIGATSPSVNKTFWIEPGVWAGGYAANESERDYHLEFDGSTAGISDHGIISSIPLVNDDGALIAFATVGAALDHTVYVEGSVATATGVPSPSTLVSYDLRTGIEVILLPEPPGGPAATTVPSLDVSVTALTSWVVAP